MYKLISQVWDVITIPYRFQLAYILCWTLVASLIEVITIAVTVTFFSIITKPPGSLIYQNLEWLPQSILSMSHKSQQINITILFIIIVTLSGLVKLVLTWKQIHLSHRIGANIAEQMYRKTLYMPYIEHAHKNSSELISGITAKAGTFVVNAIYPLLTIISSIFIGLTILGAMVVISPLATFTSFFGLGLIYFLVIKKTKKSLNRNSKEVNKASTKVVKILQEGLGGIRDIILCNLQQYYLAEFRKTQRSLSESVASTQAIIAIPRVSIESIFLGFIALTMLTLVMFDFDFLKSLPIIAGLVMGAQKLLPIIQQIYGSISSIRGGRASLEDALELMDVKSNAISHAESIGIDISFDRVIEFRDVSFAYSSKGKSSVESLSVHITKGEKIGVIGATGCGKSTFLDLSMGLLNPTSGYIYIDNIALDENNRKAWQNKIAHIPQHIYLADATVAENIALGVDPSKIDMSRLMESSSKAMISEFIQSLPSGFSTKIGERGARLSGGQRQRIGIARALYRSFEVLTLDEATNALDQDTEDGILDNILATNNLLTVILITHRLSTLKACDKIVQMDSGKIKRVGTYKDYIGWAEGG